MSAPLAFEHYEILQRPDGSPVELGRGAMGVTYKALDKNLRCHVALKAITAGFLENASAERFMREARAAAQVRHRNVASVFHLGRHGDSYFYAMEFIEGETVEAMVVRDGPLDCVFALEIAEQVATALVAAEKQQIVHRDIKPANLMLVREEDDEVLVKVIDFGLVKSTMMGSTGTGALTTHGFIGTPAFASPEQLEGQAEDVRSDIYSLGVTLWYMLTAAPPFTGSVASVISQHLVRRPPFESLAAVPAGVVSLLRAMLEKDKAKRIQTPSQLRAALRVCVERMRAPERTPAGETGFETMACLGDVPCPEPPPAGLALDGTLPPRTGPHPSQGNVAGPEARSPVPAFATRLPAPAAAAADVASPRPLAVRRIGRFLGLVTAGLLALCLLLAGGWLAFFAPDPLPQSTLIGPGPSPRRPTALPLPPGPSVPGVSQRLPLTKGRPWVNSLDMHFVPLDDSYFSVWQTRVRDFEAFVHGTGYDAVGGMSSAVTRDGVKRSMMSWINPGFAQSPDHPVVGVSWEDATQFCAWLTQKEHETGVLPAVYQYRLPSDREWSAAVGLPEEPAASPEDRDGAVHGVYPWGRTFPPPNDAANFAGRESREGAPEGWAVIPGFHDAFPRTAPASAFGPNPRGVCSLGGNVWEWCLDRFNATRAWRTLRGSSWATWRRDELLSSSRRGREPYFRSDDTGFRCVIAADEGHK